MKARFDTLPSADGVDHFGRWIRVPCAAALIERLPILPIEEEGRLHDIPLRESFVERVSARHRWLEFVRRRPRPADFVDFHMRHKLTLLSHGDEIYRKLGRLVARAGKGVLAELLSEYESSFFHALAVKATPRKHANVLYHLAGFLKEDLDSTDRAELVECTENYRRRLVPLIVPITLLKHHFHRHPVSWVGAQVYLNPYPAEMMLRNHV